MGKIVHIVLWKLKQSTNVAAGQDAYAAAKQAISALKDVPGPEVVQLGPPEVPGRTKGFDWGLYMIFSSREALEKYAVSKAHVDVVTNNVKPNVEDILAYDFELDA